MESDELQSQQQQQQQLTGFVIITLPPPTNPSLGKTITAFTISQPQPQPQPPQPQNHNHHYLPIRPRNSLPLRRAQKAILGMFFLGLVLWGSWNFGGVFEVGGNGDDDDGERNGTRTGSFVFPVYRKSGGEGMVSGDVEVKLGKFVKFGNGKLGASKAATSVLPVTGDTSLNRLYYTQILLGDPPRPYFLDMDTGSDLTWIQCDAPCTSCAKGPHPFYKPTKQNILSSKHSFCVELQGSLGGGNCEYCRQCDYEIEYADHSSSIGVLARDGLHLTAPNGSLINSGVVFGCAYDQQGLLLNSLTTTDGILGLSRAKLSIPSQLASQGIINNVIGHCLAADASRGGYMFLGDESVPKAKLTWVPMLDDGSQNFYLSEVARITYGSKQLNLDSTKNGRGRVVFDSGSSYTYFPKQAYSALLNLLKGISLEGLVQDLSDETMPLCWRAEFPLRSVEEVKMFFKPLTLKFGSKWWIISMILQIPPEAYLITSNKGNVCLGILDGSEVHDGSTIILGDISMRGLMVAYDNVNQRIGWMRSDCVMPIKSGSLPTF